MSIQCGWYMSGIRGRVPLSLSVVLPCFVDVVISQDLDGNPCLTQKHVLSQILIVPQINSAKVEDDN